MTNSSSSRKALVLQRSFSPFSNQLIQAGYVDTDQMQQALVESRKSGRSLTDVLESLTGQQLSPELLRQYKKHFVPEDFDAGNSFTFIRFAWWKLFFIIILKQWRTK